MAKVKLARVLVDIDALGVKANHVISGVGLHLEALAKQGLVDMEEAAISYAKTLNSDVIDVADKAGAFAAELAAFDEQNGKDPDEPEAPAA